MSAYAKFVVAVCLFGVLSATAFAGKFKYGFNQSHEVTLNVPRPPDAYLAKKNISVRMGTVPPAFRNHADQLRLSVERSLSPDFTASAQPDAIFQIDVIAFEPLTSAYKTQNETMSVHTGDRRVVGKDGKVSTEPVYESRQVPVQHWTGHANLQIKWSVVDGSGAALDASDGSAPYSADIVVSRAGEATNASIPTADTVISSLISGVSARFRPRYTTTHTPVKFLMAVDDELKDINKLAMAGNWAGALKQYEAVKMKNNSGDRLYNMAAAKEALAYEAYDRSQSPEEALPVFTEAIDLYDQAMKMDPSEKFIQQAATRLRSAKDYMDRANKQYTAQKFEAEKLIAEMTAKAEAEKAAREAEEREKERIRVAEEREKERIRVVKEEGAKDIESNRPDTPEEAKFRNYIRVSIKALSVDALTDDKQQQLEKEGTSDWQLEALKAKRVVVQEVKQKKQLQEGLRKYEEKFTLFAEDKKLTKDERQALSDFAELLKLSPDDMKTIESKFKVVDETRPAAPAVKPPTPLAPKPTAQPFQQKTPAPATSAPTVRKP